MPVSPCGSSLMSRVMRPGFRSASALRRRVGLTSPDPRAAAQLFEALEPRKLLATFVVNTLDDVTASDGRTSLREAVERANANPGEDTIEFDEALFDSGEERIGLTGGPLVLTGVVNLTGPGAALLALDGEGSSRVLSFTAGAAGSTVSGLAITGGSADEGAGLFSEAEGLTIDGVYFYDNVATLRGGGFFGAADGATIRSTTFASNESQGDGGAVYLTNGSYSILNSTFSENEAQGDGGAVVFGAGATGAIQNSTLFENNADAAGSGTAFGGGVAMTSDPRTDGSVVFVSTIFEGNRANGVANSVFVAEAADVDLAGVLNNLFDDVSGALGITDGANGNIVGMSAMLEPLLFGNGATPTHVPGAGTPVLNTGLNAAALDLDQRGFARIAGDAVDIGAVELRPPRFDNVFISGLSGATFTVFNGVTFVTTPSPSDTAAVTAVRVYFDANDDGFIDDSELIDEATIGGGPGGSRYIVAFRPDGNTIAPGDKRLFLRVFDENGLGSEPTEYNLTLVPSTRRINAAFVGSTDLFADTVIQRTAVTFELTFVLDSRLSQQVRYYVDTNGNGELDDGDRELAIDERIIGRDREFASVTIDEIGVLEPGLYDFLFVIQDEFGFDSEPLARTVRVFPSMAVNAQAPVVGSTDASNQTVMVTINEHGDPLVYEQNDNGYSLVERIGAPRGIGDSVVWTDPKDGLIYAAYASTDGLILLSRDVGGAWSFRNLNSELGLGAGEIVTSVTQFTSAAVSGRVTVIAGATETGTLFLFEELASDAGVYELTRLSEELASDGASTPALSELISYRPSWDSWHLAGIDLDGEVISVWRGPASETWRLDNLTDITGGDRIERGLAVILTSWNGISITGLNEGGEVVSSWWVPQFRGEWRQVNLTEAFDGPTLTNAGLTSFYTPWNTQNYVGVNEEGQVTAYWWSPQFAGDWRVDTLTARPTSPSNTMARGLTSHVSNDATLNIFGVADDDRVLRNFWLADMPEAGWRLANRII